MRAPRSPVFLTVLAILACPRAWPQSPEQTSAPLSRDAPVHFRWAAGGVLIGSPVASGGLVYCVSEDRSVNALDEEGKVLYHSDFTLSPKAKFAPAGGGALLIADGDRVIRLNRAGRPGFSIELPGAGERGFQPPAEGWDGRLFIAGERLSCVSVSGSGRWSVGLSSRASAGPVVTEDGAAAVGLSDGGVLIIGPFSEEISRVAGGKGGAVLGMYPGSGGVAYLRADGKLSFLGRDGGEVLLSSGVKAFCPAPGPGAWAALKEGGILVCLDAAGGEVWETRAGQGFDRIRAYPGRIYLLGGRAVSAFTAKGLLLKEMGLVHNAVPPEVSEEGIVYSCGMDWIVYAYRFDPDRPADYGLPPPLGAQGGYGLADFDREELEWRLGLDDGLSQAALLDEIEKSLKSATIGTGEREMAAALAAIALSMADGEAGKASRKRGGLFPQERARACELLGAMGSRESRGVLLRVAREDGEDSVRAAAIRALGSIGWDGDGSALALIREEFGRVYVPGTERSLIAAAEAIERIIRYEGVPESDDGVDALLSIAEYPAPPYVRARALSALKAIMRP
jgi:hypothetical protein